MNTLISKRISVALILAFAALSAWAQIVGPQPVAGKNLTKEYITENLVYPTADLEKGNSGKVVITMHIDMEGHATNHQVKSSFSEAALPLALHLVKTINWLPATNNGLPIEYEHEYEVEFNAKSYKRFWKHHTRPELPLTLEADTSYVIYENRQLEESAKPYFEDGSNLAQYIYSNLKFPAEAKEREIQGTVRLDFVIETNGSVSNINIINSVGGGCDNEAIRLIQETHWIPGTKNGVYVRSHGMQDITFTIGNRNFQDGNSY